MLMVMEKTPPFSRSSSSRAKIIAAVLFITLPFVGFWVGMEYQEAIMPVKTPFNVETSILDVSTITPTPDETSSWKTYRNNEHGFTFQYPGEWKLDQKEDVLGTTLTFLDGNEGTNADNILITPRFILFSGYFHEPLLNRKLSYTEYLNRFKPNLYQIIHEEDRQIDTFSGRAFIYTIPPFYYTSIILGDVSDPETIMTVYYRHNEKENNDAVSFPQTLSYIFSTFRFVDETSRE